MLKERLGTGDRCPVFVRHPGVRLRVLVVLAMCALCVPVHVLEVRNVHENRTIRVWQVVPGDAFSLDFLHSVERSPVRDRYLVDEHYRMVQTGTEFSSCNTGLPVALAAGEKLYRDGARFRIVDMKRVLPEILLWTDERYGNTLTFARGDTVKLTSPAGAMLLRVSVTNVPALGYMLKNAQARFGTFS